MLPNNTDVTCIFENITNQVSKLGQVNTFLFNCKANTKEIR
mgnify:CR=1 FL=1